MADMAMVLEGASAAGVQVGKQEVIAAGPAGRAAGSFFAVLASRMGALAKAETRGDVDALLAMKGGEMDASLAGVDLLAAASGADPDAAETQSSLATQAAFELGIPPGLIGDPARQAAGPAGAVPVQGVVASMTSSVAGEEAAIEPSSASPRNPARQIAGDTRAGASLFPHGAGQSNPAANAAVDPDARGQLLPPDALGRAGTEQTLAPLAAPSTGMSGEGLAPLPGIAGAGAEIPVPRGFEHAPRPAEARLNVSVDAPVKSPAFAGELGEKIVWLAGRQGQIAEISLNPPHMGALEVRLTVSGGEAGAQFFSVNPVVRDAIEAALPRLRELMAQAGITLGEAQVRDEAFMQGKNPEASDRNAAAAMGESGGGGDIGAMTGIGMVRARGMGLVDLYV